MKIPFLRNDVLERNDGTLHRLLRIDMADAKSASSEKTGKASLILLNEALALPYWVELDCLATEYRHAPTKEMMPTREASDLFQPTLVPLLKRPSAASLKHSEEAYNLIAPLVDEPGILEPSSRNALILRRSKEPDGATPKTLLKHLRSWWQGGQTQNSLLGDFAKCAHKGVNGTGLRGRARASLSIRAANSPVPANLRPYQLTERDRTIMRQVLEEFYFNSRERQTLSATLKYLHRNHYVYKDGNGQVCLLPATECPTYRQLEYFLKSNYPLKARELLRKGAKRFAQESRSTEGSIQLECHGAGHIYEFDATIVDIILLSSKDKKRIVGKPTLYLIIDRHSRLIVGFYLGFENANYSAAMQAILSLGEDKQALCRRLEIPYDPTDWPAHGVLPETFLADQGELMHKKARRIARSLRATLSNVPGLRPDWKPLVECSFKMIHQIIKPGTPAFSPDSENRARRAVNRDKETALDYLRCLKVIVTAIIAHNKTLQADYPLTPEQVDDRVRPIPRELFAHSVERRMGTLDRMDFEAVREELMPRDTAMVTGDGIRFEKLFYSCPEAEQLGWLVEGRQKRKPVEIAFDYRIVDEILVYSPNGNGQSFVAKLAKDSVRFAGMSLKEVKQHFHDVATLVDASKEESRQASFEYHQLTGPTIQSAIAQTKAATKGVSRSSRRKHVASARAEQLQRERQETAGVRPATPEPEQMPAASAPTGATKNVVPFNRGGVTTSAADSPRSPVNGADAAEPIERPQSLKQRMAEMRRNMSL